jgi:hypothetical protein
MPSTATSRLRLEKQSLGENSATWGQPKLNDVLDRVDEAIGGVESISNSGGTTTLTSTNYSTDQARKAVLVLTGTLASAATIIVPNAEKLYLVVNNCTMGAYSVTIKTAAGAGYALRAGPQWVYCDAVGVYSASPRLDEVAAPTAAVDLASQKITSLATPTAASDAATKAYVDGIASGLGAAIDTAATASTIAQRDASAMLNASGYVSGAGTTALPAFRFATDTNSGLRSSGADSVAITAGGVDKVTVSSTGAAVAGTLSATGAATLSSTLGVTGATTLGTLSAAGTSVTTLSASGAATFGSTLGVTGAATLSSTLAVTGAVTASSTVTAAGVILGPAGAVGAPSHSFSTDTNTGMYSGGADTLAFATGGTLRATVSSAGDIGVGASPLSNASSKTLTLSGTNGGTIELTDTGGTIGPRLWGDTSDQTLNLSSHNASGKIVLRTAAGVVRTTLDSSGNLLHGQATSTVPGFGNTTVGTSIQSGGRFFISVASGDFSNWNMNGTGSLLTFSSSASTVGSISISGVATSYNTSSDYRLKQDIEPLTGALDRLGLLQPKRFRFKSNPGAGTFDGFLAHEVTPAVPEAVTGEKDGELMQAIDPGKLVALLVGAVQELAVRVADLENA